jgi:hypothetical protein
MAKAFYADVSNYCLRFYIQNPEPHFENEVERLNWEACEKALEPYTPWEKEVIRYIFLEKGSIVENAKDISIIKAMPLNRIWRLLSNIERDVAIARKLI